MEYLNSGNVQRPNNLKIQQQPMPRLSKNVPTPLRQLALEAVGKEICAGIVSKSFFTWSLDEYQLRESLFYTVLLSEFEDQLPDNIIEELAVVLGKQWIVSFIFETYMRYKIYCQENLLEEEKALHLLDIQLRY